MKRLILLVTMMACMAGANAREDNVQKSNMMLPPHIEFRDWGVYGVLEYDFVKTFSWDMPEGFLPEDETVNMPSFNALTGIVGFQLRRQTGLGIGVTYLVDGTSAFSQLPIFVELRSHYLRSRLTPFTALQLGYSFPVGTYQSFTNSPNHSLYVATGGLMLGLQGGARFAFTRNFAMSINVGYMLLHANQVGYNDAYMVQNSMESMLFHNFKAGLAFNF